MCFYNKLSHSTCAIRCIPCDFTTCTSIIDQPWVTVTSSQQKYCYQPVKDSIYWPVSGSFKNWKIIQLSHKETSSEEIVKFIKLYYMVSARTWLNFYKLGNMVTLVQHIKLKWYTMLLNST